MRQSAWNNVFPHCSPGHPGLHRSKDSQVHGRPTFEREKDKERERVFALLRLVDLRKEAVVVVAPESVPAREQESARSK
jgi:hypothetical protein